MELGIRKQHIFSVYIYYFYLYLVFCTRSKASDTITELQGTTAFGIEKLLGKHGIQSQYFFCREKIDFGSLETSATERKRNKRAKRLSATAPSSRHSVHISWAVRMFVLEEDGDMAGNSGREPRPAAEEALSWEESSADRQKVWRDLNLRVDVDVSEAPERVREIRDSRKDTGALSKAVSDGGVNRDAYEAGS